MCDVRDRPNLDVTAAPARLVRIPNQFDDPSTVPTLATPSCGGCCCCCCCCLATAVSTPIVWATVAADDAAKHGQPGVGPAVLAVLAIPASVAVAAALADATHSGLGLVIGALVSPALVAWALRNAGRSPGGAVGRSIALHLATGLVFVLEAILALSMFDQRG